jgi:predicted phage terminase large subunit-like protein
MPNLVAERKRRELEGKKLVKVPFYDIEQHENKEKRIYQLEPKVAHGWILFNRALSEDAMQMMRAFPLGEHDDFPDAVEMLWGLVNNRYSASAVSKDVYNR